MAKKKRSSSSKSGHGGISGAASAAASGAAEGGLATALAAGAGASTSSQEAGSKAGQGREGAARQKPSALAAAKSALNLPLEITKGDWTVLLLALMMFFAPGLGVPHEEMLQDTLKSIVVSFATVSAALILFWQQRNRRDALRWHFVMWLPLLLTAYALGSMVWSHTYLGGVEAIRWFVFSLIVFLGLNTFNRERVPYLAWGIHWGAVVASLWTALQFWVDFKYFPQGPNPASTFVNRNFYAEYVVCTLPFSVLLLARARQSALIALLSFTIAFNIVALMMTGTRSALVAMLVLAFILPVVLYLYRRQFAFLQWDSGKRILATGMFLATVIGLGMISTANPKLIEENRTEGRGLTALQRGFARTVSIAQKEEFTERSFSVRLVMWKATGRIIAKRPLTGVGAGAWEVDLPLYQTAGSQLETDYYVHNEFLQLLAEYGLAGWIFLILLFGYLTRAAWQTVRNKTAEGQAEAPLRAVALAALLALFIVSNAGFAWRMASTGALFALCLAVLAASDARLSLRGRLQAYRLPWKPAYSQVTAVAMMLCLTLTVYISHQAAKCEAEIVRAVKIALTISQSGDVNNPKWDKNKTEMLALIRDGVAINPHYRKITPMVADELAKWGDWKNAIWIWESVVSSRPYVIAIMSNIARGYMAIGNIDKSMEFLQKAKKLQPDAISIRSLEVILLSRTGKEPEARKLASEGINSGKFDLDMINAGYVLGVRAKDWALAVRSLELRNEGWPAQAVDGYLKLGDIYASTEIKDETKALAAYKAALAAAPEKDRLEMRTKRIPTVYQNRL